MFLTIWIWHVKHHNYNIQIHQRIFYLKISQKNETKTETQKWNHIDTCNIRVLDSKYIAMDHCISNAAETEFFYSCFC